MVVSVVVVVREAILHTTGKVGLFCIGRICGLDTVGIRDGGWCGAGDGDGFYEILRFVRFEISA